jgi:putative salt-induced outer membrane protein YdiY
MRQAAMIVIVLVLCVAYEVRGDEVIFKNGDRLAGKVQHLVGTKLTFVSETAGTMEIEIETIKTLSTDEPITIVLTDGTVLIKRALQSEEGLFAVEEDAVVRARTFSAQEIGTINPPEKPPVKWKGTVSAGGTITRGNTKTSTYSVIARANRRGERDRISVDGAYHLGTQRNNATGNDVTTTDSWHVAGKYDYFVSRKLYTFGNARYEKDRVASLEHRTIMGAGLGWQLIESNVRNFSIEAGASWLGEEYSNPTLRNEEVSAQAGYHFDSSTRQNVTFLHNLKLYPAFGDPSDYFLTADAEIRAALTEAIFASFMVVLSYDSTPAPGNAEEDIKYIAAVGVNF